jgi:uncharacterized protein with HEPN domain
MIRDDKIYVQDIIDSIEIIFQYIGDKTEYEFNQSLLLQDAVFRRFEIIGEASTKVSENFKQNHQDIEWKLMKLMRNKLIHEYFGISTSTIYHTIHSDLPILIEKLKKIL